MNELEFKNVKISPETHKELKTISLNTGEFLHVIIARLTKTEREKQVRDTSAKFNQPDLAISGE